MYHPRPGDYIDIHTHRATPEKGIFSVEVLMAHEGRLPANEDGIAYTAGIHPWFLNEEDHDMQLSFVSERAAGKSIIAIGETGFDRLKGPDIELQKKTFEEQVSLAGKYELPMVIHCVKAWEELLAEHRRLKPRMPWLIHGFRGKKELALQLISRGMYLSFWFDFITRPEATPLIRSLPVDHIFLETDGSGTDIRNIYNKVSDDLGLTVEELKSKIFRNFESFFSTHLRENI
jgi:TatD DNase family protein